MASAVSYEFLQNLKGAPNGLATLDNTSKIPVAQLPPSSALFLGIFATSADLPASAELAQFAYVTGTLSFWYWNPATDIDGWVNQQIEEADYILLTNEEQSYVPYVVITTVTP